MVAIIAALAKNRVIGRGGEIPWDLPEDREHFRRLTWGHVIVMGRRTFEEIGQPLPGRMTYLISSTMQIEQENCHTVTSLPEVLEKEKGRDIFICGGAMLYEEAMPLAERLYLTELDWEEPGDTFFPIVDTGVFRETERVTGECGYAFVTYERILSE